MIKAEGKRYGKKIKVVYEDGHFLFNGEKNKVYEDVVRYEMSVRHPIAGTYFAEKEDDALNIAEVLRAWFFDEPNVEVDIQDEEYEEMPSEGFVY